jgi:hypothetical protein
MHPQVKRPTFVFPEYDADLNIVGAEGAMVMLGYLAHNNDLLKYQGLELQRVCFDELTQYTEAQYLYLFSRMRATFNPVTGEAVETKMLSSCNPHGPGVAWVKRRFVDKLEPEEIGFFTRDDDGREQRTHTDDPMGFSRQWVPGYRHENLALDNAAYEAALRNLGRAEYRALALGMWEVEAGPRQLFDPKWVDRALSGEIAHVETPWDAIGADVAHGGGDKAVIVRGNGNRLLTVRWWEGLMNEFAPLVHMEWVKYPDIPCQVAIDSNGIGAGEANTLQFGGTVNMKRENGEEFKYEVTPVPSLERCILKDDLYDDQWRGAMRFKNFKAQAYHKLKEDLRLGRIDLSPINEHVCMHTEEQVVDSAHRLGGAVMVDIHLLQEEFSAIEYDDDDGWFKVSDKKRLRKTDMLGRSPDFLDAIVYWNWVRERPLHVATMTREQREAEYVRQLAEVSGVEEFDAYDYF